MDCKFINQTRFDFVKEAVSIKQLTGKTYDPAVLAKELCTFLDEAFNESIDNPDELMKTYRLNLFQLNEKVKLKKGNRIFEARILDVTDNGQLVVYHGTEETFEVGEIEWLV